MHAFLFYRISIGLVTNYCGLRKQIKNYSYTDHGYVYVLKSDNNSEEKIAFFYIMSETIILQE